MVAAAYVDEAGYKAKYEASIRNPEAFLAEEGKRIHWFTPYTRSIN
jgi:acetyl-CoA synthetase